jgi:uncharacterized RDD family membrane protein YckC
VSEQLAAVQGDSSVASSARAGFWIRFGGSFIDGIIVGVVGALLGVALKGPGNVLAIVLGAIYFTYLIGGPGQTVGMKAVGIRVIDIDGGGSIGFGRAFVRWVGSYISTIFVLLGYFWMLWDKENQCWHDKMASDVVVPA